MYNHRIIAFMIFTTAFWIAEMVFAALGWLALRTYLMPKEEVVKEEELERAKDEDSDEIDLSDVPLTSPHSDQLLRRPPAVKDEDTEESVLDDTDIPRVAGEPDGEEVKKELSSVVGSASGRVDSAIGTSYSEGSVSEGLARRRSRGGHVGD